MRLTYLALATVAALSGCSLIPDYQRPAAPIEGQWPAAVPVAASPEALTNWSAFFLEPNLQALQRLALENNRDVRIAALNVQAFASQYRIQRADLLPQLDAQAGLTRTRTPSDLSLTGNSLVTSQYNATVGASWELDFFGRLDSLKEAALERYFASLEGQRATQTGLLASVATVWLNYQADQALLKLTQDTLETYEQSLTLTQRSFDVGVVSALELSQAQSAVDTAQVNLARYQRLLELDRNALTLLVGQTPAEALLTYKGLSGRVLAPVPVGVPAALLQQRPDILQAEYQLKAANADIGAARAAFFPRISLTGVGGAASDELSGLFGSGSGYWSFVPSISVPIFTAGKLKANLDYSRISQEISVAQYEKAIQSAFKDVADGLVAHRRYAEQLSAQRNLVSTNERYYQVAERRYRAGIDSYLILLDAQRQLFSVQQQLINDQLAQLVSEVNLYKAVGGGWKAVGTGN